VCRGRVLPDWKRFEPAQQLDLLSGRSLGDHWRRSGRPAYRSVLLYMGRRVEGDFGFAWDSLRFGRDESERAALVPVSTAQAICKAFEEVEADPVWDEASETAQRALAAYHDVKAALQHQPEG
jgi:hypothetical protein